MLRNLIIVAIVAVVTVTAFQGTRLGWYVTSELRSLRERAEANIPPEKEVVRLREEVRRLDKDIVEVINQLAKENVQTAQLEERVQEMRKTQGRARELLEARAAAIKNATDFVVFDSRKLTLREAKAVLEDGVRRYQLNQKTLESMEQALQHRLRIRDTLQQQLEALRNQKAELSAAIDALEADLTVLKLQQMESRYQTDDSRLARIKESIRNLQTQIQVEREKLRLLPVGLEESPQSRDSGDKSVDEIMAALKETTSKQD